MTPLLKTIWRVSWISFLFLFPVIVYLISNIKNYIEGYHTINIFFLYVIYAMLIFFGAMIRIIFLCIIEGIIEFYKKQKKNYYKKTNQSFWKRIHNGDKSERYN